MDCFLEETMEKGILDIELTNGPSTRNSKRKNDANSDRLDHRREGFGEVNAFPLVKTFGHQTSFETLNLTRGGMF